VEILLSVRDPREPDARRCLEAYVGELGRRFDAGFDPALSISATADEMTPPAAFSDEPYAHHWFEKSLAPQPPQS
jgi:hypothetical protein